MSYIDGFVAAVSKRKLPAYKKIAKLAGKVWRDHGAIAYVEAVADDVPYGKLTSFPRSVKLKKNEIVVVAYITYKSRKSRDAVLKKVMADPRMKMDPKNMPFDMKRMIYGGFKSIVEF